MSTEPIHVQPEEMRAALEFTAAQTGFSARLIEKDYWCSLILRELFADDSADLVFKGGTLLSKAYAIFDRLSEDLDFTLPTTPETRRNERSWRAAQIEKQFQNVAQRLGLAWDEAWRGFNQSTQHRGRLTYASLVGGTGSILLELGQREQTLFPPERVALKTLLLDPLFSEPVVPEFSVLSLSRIEAYAEKARAALTREEPAIRDLYDLWRASEAGYLGLDDAEWLAMVLRKCADYDLTESCSPSRLSMFESGLDTHLVPVLRAGATFSFPDARDLLVKIHRLLSSQ